MSFTTSNYVLGGEATFPVLEIKSHPTLPDGKYEFQENYCTEPNCDCRKTIINIKHNGELVGSIDYGWETLKFYKKWARNNSDLAKDMVGLNINPLSEYRLNPYHLLGLIETLMDDKWSVTIKNTYQRFRHEIDAQHARSKSKPETLTSSRNSLCPCGSGKKYKRCCIDEVSTTIPQDIIPFPTSIPSLHEPPAGYDPFESDPHFLAEISPELERQVDQALVHIDKKQFKKAKNILTPLLENHPLQASVHYAMGVHHAMQDDAKGAIPYFEEAVNILPYFVEAWHNLGQAYRLDYDILRAIYAARKVIEYAEDDAEDQQLAKKNQDFIDDFAADILETEGMKLDDYLITLEIFDAAFFLMENADYKGAIEGFESVLKVTPKNQQTHGNIASCYAKLGDKTKALHYIEKSLEIDPTYQVAKDNKILFQDMTDGEPLDLPSKTVNYSATGLKPI